MSYTPDYVVCLNCETPTYEFEWANGELVEVLCEVCGEDEPAQFATPDDVDALEADQREAFR